VLGWLASGFFAWLSLCEIYSRYVPRTGFARPNADISIPYVVTTAVLSGTFAHTPLRCAHFKQFLTKRTQILSESTRATVHCNTFVDLMFDSQVFSAGHAQFDTGRIVFQHPWGVELIDHLKRPDRSTRAGVLSVQIFVHESMHIRGEHNEEITECQAIQRYVRAAKLLGVSEFTAKQTGMAYYIENYKQRATHGWMSNQYHSDQCAPGKALDEKPHASTWN
jgi:hypothetical protein